MSARVAPLILAVLLPACTGKSDPAPELAKSAESEPAQASGDSSSPQPGEQAEPASTTATPENEPPEPAPTTAAPEPEDALEPPSETGETGELPEAPTVMAEEVEINPWSATSFTASWALAAEPSEALALVLELDAGVLGQAGSTWYQVGADGQLVVAEMDVEPKLPVLGVWPSDAWFVDKRMRKYDDEGDEYLEIRLMKLRGGKRWVPQAYNGEQWFHPGTEDWDEAHMSTRSGMLVYPASLERITRVAGKHSDPDIGSHRGRAVDFIEAGSGKVYLISRATEGYYAQVECQDDDCVISKAQKLPLDSWKFGRKAARGKHSVSVLATSGAREFILHHRGKSGGWVLDELPAGEQPQGIWASQEGGLWTLTGDKLRWRDTESAWREVALPEGMTSPSVALSEDRKQVWISGVVGGAPKVFTTSANAEAATP
ncbi:MAG: hypothetical protein R6X02_22665 [Enhygromyxa sp.]